MRIRALALTVICGGLLAGCGAGHGRHTSEQISRAQSRLGQIRSATEWEMAHQAFLAGDLERAADRAERSISLNPAVVKSRVLMGRILLEQGRLEEARSALIEAELLDPESVEPQYYLALVHERFSQKEEALDRYLRAAALDPSEPQYAIAATEMLVDLDRLPEAMAYLTDREGVFEHNSGVRQTQGHLAEMNGDHGRAAELFSEARLLAPDEPGILEDLARAQVNVGQYAEAEYNLDLLLRMSENRDRRDLEQLRASCLLELDRPMEARELLISLSRDASGSADADTWLRLGQLAYETRDWTRLREAGHRLIAIEPGMIEGYVYRAVWQRRHDDPSAALATLDRGIERCGESIDAVMLLGLLHGELGHRDEAISSMRRVLSLEPEHGGAITMLDSFANSGFTSVNPDEME